MALKVILDVIPEYMERLTVKHVNQRRCLIIYAFQSGKRIRGAPRSEWETSTLYTYRACKPCNWNISGDLDYYWIVNFVQPLPNYLPWAAKNV